VGEIGDVQDAEDQGEPQGHDGVSTSQHDAVEDLLKEYAVFAKEKSEKMISLSVQYLRPEFDVALPQRVHDKFMSIY
jgi:hypothetical protein